MLYDPKWTKPAAVVWSLDRLIAWLETMPAGEQYCYTAGGECLLAQYLKGIGWATDPLVDSTSAEDMASKKLIKIPAAFNEIARESWRETGSRTNTFGAALERARRHAGR
jgi:hypothetical protein